MKRILLVYTMSHNADTIEHIGLEYLAAVLRKKNHLVKLSILRVNNGIDQLEQTVLDFHPDIIGFTTFSESLLFIISACQIIKNSNMYIVFGGHAATHQAQCILSDHPYIDFIIKGEGEETFCELAEWDGDTEKLQLIDGLVYRDLTGIIHTNTPRKAIEDLDSLPFPARDLYLDAEPRSPIALVSTSRGCLAHCSFCGYSSHRPHNTPAWRGRSPTNVVDELQWLNKEHGINTFFITDATIEDPGQKGKTRIRSIADEILSRNLDISYEAHMRAESWNERDIPLLELLFKSGLESTVIGLESGSGNGLRVYDKLARLEDNIRIVDLLSQTHIALEYGFILFHPYLTFAECHETIAFFRKVSLGYNIKSMLTRLELYSGVSMVGKLQSDGLLANDFSYKNGLFDYQFIDNKIARLSNALCALPALLPCIEEFDFVNKRYRVFLARCWRRLHNRGIMQEQVIALGAQDKEMTQELVDNNTVFLESCLDLAQSSWSDSQFRKLVQHHLAEKLPKKIAEIKGLQNKFIKLMHKHGVDISRMHL